MFIIRYLNYDSSQLMSYTKLTNDNLGYSTYNSGKLTTLEVGIGIANCFSDTSDKADVNTISLFSERK